MSGVEPGQTFGRWTVVRPASPRTEHHGERQQQRPRAHVRCVCGREKRVEVRDLRNGRGRGCTSGRCRQAWAVEQAVARARRGGEDEVAQLEAAIELLQKQIADDPIDEWKPAAHPDKSFEN